MHKQSTLKGDEGEKTPYIGWLNLIAAGNVLGFIFLRACGYEMSWWWLLPATVLVCIVFIASMVASGAVKVRKTDEKSAQEQPGTESEPQKDKR
jgi:hypothetical protein